MIRYAGGRDFFVFISGRRTLTAVLASTVESVDVQPGQRVAANDALVRFCDVEQAAEL